MKYSKKNFIKYKSKIRWLCFSSTEGTAVARALAQDPFTSDMDDEMLSEAVDTAVTSCDKFPQNNELAAQMLKVCADT